MLTVAAVALIACLSIGATTAPTGLRDPAKKDVAMQLVSAAENSSLDWRKQYRYIEYDVEGNPHDNRGYTAGLIGFTSKTGDMLEVVQRYERLHPGNALSPFLPALTKVNGSSSQKGLGQPFVTAWQTAARDVLFKRAQMEELNDVYFDPAVEQAQRDGLRELGQFIYYDAIVMHGPGDDADSFGGIRTAAMKNAKLPRDGGDEATYLNAFLDARVAAMKREQAHDDVSRVETMQRVFVRQENWNLQPPLVFAVYGDQYRIEPRVESLVTTPASPSASPSASRPATQSTAQTSQH